MKTYLMTVFAIASAAIFYAAPAQAQASRTWVSGVGDDANPCSRTAPCKTFAGAISKTAVFGEINCLDSGGFGAVTITKSITIKCEGVIGGILAAGTTGVLINDGGGATPNTAIVTLSGLDIEGFATGINGIRFLAGAALHVHKTQIRGFRASGAGGVGILIDPATGGKEIYVADSYITDNGSNATTGGIVFRPAGGGGNISINRTQIENNSSGIIVDGSNTSVGAISGTISNSVVAGSANNGITAITTAGHAAANVMVDRVQVAFNVGSGINANGATASGAGSATVRVGGSTIASNVTGVSVTGNGQLKSYTTNQLNGNGTDGTFALHDAPQ